MEKSIKRYLEDLKVLLNYKPYSVSVLLVSVLSYGYAMFNTAISIDDLEYDRYVGSGNVMLSAGRFGMWFWSFIEGEYENSYLIDLFAVILFILATTSFCVLFRRITRNRISAGALTVFSCMFISYPLINEIWEYTGANVNICGAFFLCAITILLMHEQIHIKNWRNPWRIIVSSLCMMIVCAGYESVISVYVFFVFAVLAMQMIYGKKKEKKFLEFMRQGIIYASVLVAGLVLRVVVHQIILKALDLTYKANGEVTIQWGTRPLAEIIKNLIADFSHDYFARGIVYMPIGVLVISVVAFIVLGLVACKKHTFLLIIPGLGMLLCLVLLSLVQGSVSPYRTCQVFAAFSAFAFMLIIDCIPRNKSKSISYIRVTALVLCGYLCFSQAAYLNQLFEANYRRSESEAFAVRQMIVDLRRDFDPDKAVIFIGDYPIDPDILEDVSISKDSYRWKLYEKVYVGVSEILNVPHNVNILPNKLPDTNVRSHINWSRRVFSQTAMQKLFDYYGYSFELANYYGLYDEAVAYATENNMPEYPQKGYIKDVGDYIIVNL